MKYALSARRESILFRDSSAATRKVRIRPLEFAGRDVNPILDVRPVSRQQGQSQLLQKCVVLVLHLDDFLFDADKLPMQRL